MGAGGEPVDFWRTVNSHGLNDLLPNRIDVVGRTLELTLHPGPQTVLVRRSDDRTIEVEGRAPRRVAAAVRHVLRLDEDLSALYAQLVKKFPSLQIQASGGVSSLDDLRGLKPTGSAGVIVGRALYEKKFTLKEALAC